MQLILKNIARHITLTADEEAYFLSILHPKKIKRKHFFLQEGEINRQTSFVLSGTLRAYTIDENGFEHILQFAPPDWWIADMYSFIAEKPGNLNIEAIEDTEVLTIQKKDLEQLYSTVPKFERFFRIITEKSLVAMRQRLIDNLSLTAKKRYQKFCQQYPSLINSLPQKQIAAYIGVTPEFLSKMLKEKN